MPKFAELWQRYVSDHSMFLLTIWENIAVSYFFIYNSIHILLLLVTLNKMRYFLRKQFFTRTQELFHSSSTPSVSILVPAFNEALTIVESLQSLAQLRYPHFEILVVNDGSTDETLQTLIDTFGFVRKEVGYENNINSAMVYGFYEAEPPEATHVERFVLIDKANGGKADALNVAMNAANSPYVCCIDSDSLLDPEALLQVMQPIVEDPEGIAACGGQVGIVNGCTVEKGKVTKIGLPKSAIGMFQVVEYMRSFTAGRTALAELNSLLILSGVFAVFRRDRLVEIGGFLSGRTHSRIAQEYTDEAQTVCEDMEIIVRLQRYLLEKKLPGRIMFLPYPICWSQGPENFKDLGKQRSRWYRGLIQVLVIHIKMLFNPRYKQVGLFAMPYQFLFEMLGPMLEMAGYISLPLFYFLGMLNAQSFGIFLKASIVYGMVPSILAVILGIWTQKQVGQKEKTQALFRYTGFKNTFRLLIFAAGSTLGYRQVQLFYQLHGLLDFLKGNQAWGKFAREKF